MPRIPDPWHPPFLGFFNYHRCYFANEALNSYFFALMVGIGINKNLACEILRLRRVAFATYFITAAVRSLRSFFNS